MPPASINRPWFLHESKIRTNNSIVKEFIDNFARQLVTSQGLFNDNWPELMAWDII